MKPKDRLVAPSDPGMFVPPELAMFAELFRKRRDDWEIVEETDVLPLGDGFWVPDFRLRHKATLKMVRLEVLGFWRKSSAEKHLARLKKYIKEPFLLAVSDALNIVNAHAVGYQNATGFMRSSKAKAFDLTLEKDPVRDAYGRNQFGNGCLLARRLVEIGLPFVEVK